MYVYDSVSLPKTLMANAGLRLEFVEESLKLQALNL